MEQTTLPETVDPPATSSPEETANGLEALYGQEVDWESCGRFECATVDAPLDWTDPSSGTIEIAVKRSAATGNADQRIGSLLINPGGPGGSGIEYLDYAVSQILGEDVLRAYDVVGFDPRGVGESSAVQCGDDADVDRMLTSVVTIESQQDLDAARAELRAFGELCRQDTGPLLAQVDTVSAARDMDLLRAVLGDERLHYAGFSYGTFLGATYAGLYPERVGRFLLDGALDPSISMDDLVRAQARGFEEALRAYVEHCQAGAQCPLPGDVEDGTEAVRALVDQIETRALRADAGMELNSTMAFYGIIVGLYGDEYWSLLTAALEEAIEQRTGAVLLELANTYLRRNSDGTYLNNSLIAFRSINCLDYPTDAPTYAELEAIAEEVAQEAPTFGRDFVMGAGCEAWPIQSTAERAPIAAEGAAPILVVGTTGDPATPYEWSVSLAQQLTSGVLVTYEGEGHTAYGRSNRCVRDAVERYLVDGDVPDAGLVC